MTELTKTYYLFDKEDKEKYLSGFGTYRRAAHILGYGITYVWLVFNGKETINKTTLSKIEKEYEKAMKGN